jgi:hypothetical protein
MNLGALTMVRVEYPDYDHSGSHQGKLMVWDTDITNWRFCRGDIETEWALNWLTMDMHRRLFHPKGGILKGQ